MQKQRPHPLFFKNIHVIHPASIFAGLVLIFVLNDVIEDIALYGWFAALFIVTIARIGLSQVYPYSGKNKKNQTNQKVLLFAGITLSGVVWASAPWLLFPQDNAIKQMFIVFVLMGITAGSPAASGSSITAFLCFSQPILHSLFFRFLYEDESVYYIMALLTQVYNVALIISSINFSKIDSRLRAAIKASEKANLAKSEFLANMSHEFLTPMNAIVGINRLLKQTPLTKEQSDYVEKSGIASNSLLGVIEDILDYSKIESQQSKLHTAPFQLQTVLDTATTLVELDAKKKGLELSSHITSSTAKLLKGDAVKLAQILSNLMKNAVKFTNSGKVVLRIEQIDQTDESALIIFSVKDTGIGIHLRDHKDLFQSFSQINTSHSRTYSGTGLGLCISQQLANLMGSEIEVESEPNLGSHFYFSVWLEKNIDNNTDHLSIDESNQLTERPNSKTFFEHYSVLLIDDDKLNLMIAKSLLQQLGLQVKAVGTARLAFNSLNTQQPDVIFLDIQMPEIDGYEALSIIQSNEKWQHIPVICLTAHTSPAEKEKAISAGMSGFLTKPINPKSLKDVLLQCLPKHTFKTSNELNQVKSQTSLITEESAAEVKQNLNNLIIMLNSKEATINLLHTAIHSLTESTTTIQNNLNQQNWEHASKEAHRLRGTANLYGSTRLQNYLADIDNGLHNSENYKATLDKLKLETELIINLMTKCLEEIQKPQAKITP